MPSESSLGECLHCRAEACEGVSAEGWDGGGGGIADPDQSKQVILGLMRRLLQFISTAAGVARAVIYLETSRPPRQNNYP